MERTPCRGPLEEIDWMGHVAGESLEGPSGRNSLKGHLEWTHCRGTPGEYPLHDQLGWNRMREHHGADSLVKNLRRKKT